MFTEEQIDSMSEELKGFEIDSYELSNALSGWFTEIFLDLTDGTLFRSQVLSQGSSINMDDDYLYLCRIAEKKFEDYFPDIDEELTQDEMVDVIAEGLVDARFYDFIVDMLKWYEDGADEMYRPHYDEYLY